MDLVYETRCKSPLERCGLCFVNVGETRHSDDWSIYTFSKGSLYIERSQTRNAGEGSVMIEIVRVHSGNPENE